MMISRLLDGDLSNDESAELTAHLDACVQCKKLLHVYQMQTELVSASFGDKALPVDIVARLFAAPGRQGILRAPRFFRFIPVVSIVVFCAIFSGTNLLTTVHTAPVAPLSVILESTHPSTMCVPFSSLIYYEEYSGAAVHSQFVKMSPQRAGFTSTEAQQFAAASFYESPLFGDNATETVNGTSEEK
jgi:hypothetical protein